MMASSASDADYGGWGGTGKGAVMVVTEGGWEGKRGAVTVSSCSAVTNNVLLQQTNDICMFIHAG